MVTIAPGSTAGAGAAGGATGTGADVGTGSDASPGAAVAAAGGAQLDACGLNTKAGALGFILYKCVFEIRIMALNTIQPSK